MKLDIMTFCFELELLKCVSYLNPRNSNSSAEEAIFFSALCSTLLLYSAVHYSEFVFSNLATENLNATIQYFFEECHSIVS
jgi:hypothetical protein